MRYPLPKNAHTGIRAVMPMFPVKLCRRQRLITEKVMANGHMRGVILDSEVVEHPHNYGECRSKENEPLGKAHVHVSHGSLGNSLLTCSTSSALEKQEERM